MTSELPLKPVADGLYIVGFKPVLYVKSEDALVVADIHLGYEEAMALQGAFFPRLQLKKALKTISEARGLIETRRIIVNGDIKHSFDKLLRQERLEVEEFVVKLQGMGFKELIFIRGNHDNYVTPLLRRLGVTIVEDALDVGGGIRLTHGHLDLELSSDVTVIGHEHPAIQVNVGGSKIKLAALLLIPTTRSSLIVAMPALGLYQTGNTITMDRDKFLSPLVRSYGIIEDITPIIVDENLGVIQLPRLGDPEFRDATSI